MAVASSAGGRIFTVMAWPTGSRFMLTWDVNAAMASATSCAANPSSRSTLPNVSPFSRRTEASNEDAAAGSASAGAAAEAAWSGGGSSSRDAAWTSSTDGRAAASGIGVPDFGIHFQSVGQSRRCPNLGCCNALDRQAGHGPAESRRNGNGTKPNADLSPDLSDRSGLVDLHECRPCDAMVPSCQRRLRDGFLQVRLCFWRIRDLKFDGFENAFAGRWLIEHPCVP